MPSEPLSDDLIRAIERTRAEYKIGRVRLLLDSGLEDHAFRVAEIVAVAASYRASGPHAHLTNCATLPPHRGRGLHGGLIRRRLHDLAGAGVVHAAADTTPYSGSHRNLERAGFRLAYQKTHWERMHD